jgi:hypothetical protein
MITCQSQRMDPSSTFFARSMKGLINCLNRALHGLTYRMNNRWIARTHALTAHPRDVTRGSWRDLGQRFVPCMFNELVNFVEIEAARAMVSGNRELMKRYGCHWIHRFFFLSTWRSSEAGIDHLKWSMSLTNRDLMEEGDPEEPSHQARAAMEILELYSWWKEVVPARQRFEETGDWRSYTEVRHSKGFELFAHEGAGERKEEADRSVSWSPTNHERLHDEEEEQMMIRLIRLRHVLWL